MTNKSTAIIQKHSVHANGLSQGCSFLYTAAKPGLDRITLMKQSLCSQSVGTSYNEGLAEISNCLINLVISLSKGYVWIFINRTSFIYLILI